MRWGLVFLALIVLDAAAAAEPVPLPRPRPPAWNEPRSFAEAAGPGFEPSSASGEPTDCDKRLAAVAVFEAVPRLIGPGACGGADLVRLGAVLIAQGAPVALKPEPVLRCAMAESLAGWVREDVGPRVGKLGTALQEIETFDDFDCRGRNRVAGAKLSEHGKANAVDVRALRLADRRLLALVDPAAPKDLRDDLKSAACRRFTTVLGPGSDGYHEAHVHLDLAERRGGYRICQWDVRVPANPPQVPLPRAKPAELAQKP